MEICFQCKQPITTVETFSIEHKLPWLHSPNPSQMYFDLENIAFSHLRCNIAANRYLGPPADPEGCSQRANARKRNVYFRKKEREYYAKTYSPAKRRANYLRQQLKSKREGLESN